jgi:hypothetical protein
MEPEIIEFERGWCRLFLEKMPELVAIMVEASS